MFTNGYDQCSICREVGGWGFTLVPLNPQVHTHRATHTNIRDRDPCPNMILFSYLPQSPLFKISSNALQCEIPIINEQPNLNVSFSVEAQRLPVLLVNHHGLVLHFLVVSVGGCKHDGHIYVLEGRRQI